MSNYDRDDGGNGAKRFYLENIAPLGDTLRTRLFTEYIPAKGYRKETLVAHGIVQAQAIFESSNGPGGRPYSKSTPVIAAPMGDRSFHCVNYLTYPREPRFMTAACDAEHAPGKLGFLGLGAFNRAAATVFLTEGLWDMLTLYEAGYHVLGLPGVNNLRKGWCERLLDGRHVVVFFDNDAPGREWAARHSRLLARYAASVKVVALPPSVTIGQKTSPVKDITDLYRLDPEEADKLVQRLMEDTPEWAPQAQDDLRRSFNDLGNAERLVTQFGAALKYTPQRGWVRWDGRRWLGDLFSKSAAVAIECAKEVIKGMDEKARTLKEEDGDDEAADILSKWAEASRASRRINDMIALAQSDPRVRTSYDVFDADPFLLNCENGIIDLRTGRRMDHSADKLQSRLAPVAHDPEARCPLWLKFLDRVIADPERVEFLQRAVGYSLTAKTDEHKFFLLHGAGANGKSVFLETVKFLMGDYAQSSRFEAFAVKNNGATNDIARLHTARGVFVSETAEYQKLNESLIKDIVSGDTISARFMYHEFFDFQPHCKVWIRGNHRPVIRDQSYGMWRRVVLVEFRESIPEKDRDPALLEKLKRESPGILNWAVEGCLRWQCDGLRVPKSIEDDVQEYKKNEDTLGLFLDDCTEEAPIEHRVSSKDLYAEYLAWCEDNGIKPQYQSNKIQFGIKLKNYIPGRIKKREKHTSVGPAYFGIGIRKRF